MSKKQILLLLLVIFWCFIIFYASSRTSTESNGKSKEIIYLVTKRIVKITNYFHFTEIDVKDEKWFQKTVTELNKPLRKCAHASVYFILGILLFILLKNLSLSRRKIIIVTISLCFLYSLTDEYHQTLIEGRTGQFSDCLIDTSGSILGTAILFFFTEKGKKRNPRIEEKTCS